MKKTFIFTSLKVFFFSLVLAGVVASCNAIRVGEGLSMHHTTQLIMDEQPVFCSSSSDQLHDNKILFVVDYTKSNHRSDPHREIRLSGVRNIISHSQNNNSVKYGFLTFSNRISSPLVKYQLAEFTSDPSKLDQVMKNLSTIKDQGVENYSDLLSVIQKTIRQEQYRSRSILTDYYIFFISDGSTSPYSGESEFHTRLKNWIQSQNNVQFHAVYYGQYKDKRPKWSQTAKKGGKLIFKTWLLLETGFISSLFTNSLQNPSKKDDSKKDTDDVSFFKNISQSGNGSYTDYNKDSHVSFDLNSSFVPIRQFLVYNLNAGFCLDGHVGVDSDADGLCDQDEEQMDGFQKDNRFSFNDGYGDYLHWWSLNQQERSLPPCLDRKDSDYDLLTNCEEHYLNFIYKDRDLMKELSIHNPDSDGDGLIDGLEMMVYLADEAHAPLNPHNLHQIRISGELSDMDKISMHLSPFQKQRDQMQAPYDTRISASHHEGGSCYVWKQNLLPTYATVSVKKNDTLYNLHHQNGENLVLIYSLHSKENSSQEVYRFYYHRFQHQPSQMNQSVTFSMNQALLHTLTFQK